MKKLKNFKKKNLSKSSEKSSIFDKFFLILIISITTHGELLYLNPIYRAKKKDLTI